MEKLHSTFTLFVSLLVEAMPFLFIGVLLSSALLLLIDEQKLLHYLPRQPILAAVMGSCIGFLFPVCECGNVPVARRLLIKGVPTSFTISFLLAAPTINPIVIWSTWIAFRDQPEIVYFRVGGSLLIAILMGWIFSVQKSPQHLLQPQVMKRLFTSSPQGAVAMASTGSGTTPALLQSGSYLLGQSGQPLKLDWSMSPTAATLGTLSAARKWTMFLNNVVLELRELGSMLVFGSAIAASIQVFFPRELVLSLGQDALSSITAMMLLAGLVSICSTVDAFFALSFAATFTTSSLIAFLIFGPMIDIKNIGLMASVFKPRLLIYLFALTAQLTFLFALIHSYLA